MGIITITNENFDKEVLASERPVLLEFWTEWCGPCQMMQPIMEEVAAEVPDTKVAAVNTDNYPELAGKYGIMTVPTLVLIVNGKVEKTSVGVKGKSSILSMVRVR